MKKAAVFLSVILFGSVQGFSQHRTMDYIEKDYYGEEVDYIIKHSNPNSEVSVATENSKGDVLRTSTFKVNGKHKITFHIIRDKKENELYKNVVDYQGENLLSKEVFKRGKLKYKSENKYNEDYRLAYLKRNGKGEILFKNVNTYTDNEFKMVVYNQKDKDFVMRKKLKTSIDYKKGGLNQRNKWVYDYDESGKRTKTTLYNKKNEVKHAWDYSCKTEGELVAKKKETQFCRWQELEDGMLVKVLRKTTPKGKVEKTIHKYDSDTNLVEYTRYVNDVLAQKSTYGDSQFKPLTWEFYRKGNLKTKHEYVYNQSGEKIGYKTFWGKNITKIKRETKYVYKDEKLAQVDKFKNGSLFKTSKISYN